MEHAEAEAEANANHNDDTTTFQSTYPGIHDYDALKYLQMRYQFRDHEFIPLQWKAMQMAGWTYGSGTYKSPAGQRLSGSANELKQWLDSCCCAVPPVRSNLQRGVELLDQQQQQPTASTSILVEDGKESVQDLRNAICYHMQLLTEKGQGDDDDDTKPTAGEISTGGSSNNNNNKLRVLPKRAAAARARAVVSVTAVEKGSDLYLHKKGRQTKSSKRSKEDTTASSSFCNLDDLPSFPTLAECAALMNTFDVLANSATIEAYHAQHCFAQWRHVLSTNHSLLLYGNGSKYNLLTSFCNVELCQEGYALQIDGFDPDVSIDGILDLLVQLFLHGREPDPRDCEGLLFLRRSTDNIVGEIPEIYNFRNSPTAVDRAVVIGRALAKRCAQTLVPVFLVIHSLEGLCNELAQDALAALVVHAVPDEGQVAAIRLVASIDQVDASAALWSSSTAFKFGWFWKEIHTYRPYIRELAMLADEDLSAKKAARKQNRATDQAARVLEVLKNLAPRYGEVMQVLAKLQLKELKSSSASPWVDYKVFRSECKSGFLIDKESKLRTLQTELTDHRLMISKTEGRSEFVSIPYNMDKLKEIISYKRSIDK
jgi:Origin recognition complex subunit 2